MKAQNVMSQLVSNYTSPAKDTGKVSAASDASQFSDVMNRNMAKDSNAAEAPQQEKNIAGTKVNSQKTVSDAQTADANANEAGADMPKDVQAAGKAQAQTEAGSISDEGMADMELEIKQMLKDITGMTDEELAEILSQCNFTITDFFDFSKLQQFIVAVNGGEDVSVLLTDEAAAGQFAELYGQLKALQDDMQPFMGSEEAENVDLALELPVEQQAVAYTADMPEDAGGKKFADTIAAAGSEAVSEDAQAEGPVIMVESEKDSTFTGSSTDSSSEAEEEFDGTQTAAAKEQADMHQVKESPAAVFAQNLVNAGNAHQTAVVAESPHVQQMMDIVNQVVEQIKISLKPEAASMDMMLNPESLGRLQLTVESKGGVMTANFIVQNEVAKEAIESQIQVLRDQLEEKNIKVEAVEVNVSDFDFEGSSMAEGEMQEQQEKQASAHRRIINLDTMEEAGEELTEEEELTVSVMKQNGSSVDFIA